MLLLVSSPCAYHVSEFPECKTKDFDPGPFRVHYFQYYKLADITDPTKVPYRYCPAPRDASSCGPVVEPMTAAMTKNIEARINAFFDRLELEPPSARASLQEYGSIAASTKP